MSAAHPWWLLVKVLLSVLDTCGGILKVPSVGNLEATMFSLIKPGVGQNIATHASFTARKLFFFVLILTFLVYSPSFLSKPSPYFLTVLVLTNAVSCVDPQNKISHHPSYWHNRGMQAPKV